MPLALISVYDKSGLVPFAKRLAACGWRFLASGGTAVTLKEAGLEPIDIAAYTGSPELLAGRVKTLHPAIHAGILARPLDEDFAELRAHGYEPIDLVVVNLYPFEETVRRLKADAKPLSEKGIKTKSNVPLADTRAPSADEKRAFTDTTADANPAPIVPSASLAEAEIIEQIDIGGVALLRAAAKNYARVGVLCDPADYDLVACEIEKGSLSSFTLRTLAAKAFARTRDYDTAIAAWFAESIAEGPISGDSMMQAPRLASFGTTPGDETPGSFFSLVGRVERTLRYGENPHQKALFVLPVEISAGQLSKELFTLFKEPVLSAEPIISKEPILEKRSSKPEAIGQTMPDSASGIICGPLGGHVLGGKELSYNNLLDLDAAWRAVLDFEAPAVVIVKHLSPCGAAEGNSLREAYEAALACDPVSAFGGIVALNRPLDSETALALKELFIECVAAPGFDEAGLEILRAKKNLRLIEADPYVFAREARELRSAAGGLLVQEQDRGDPIDTKWSVVSKRQPTAAEWEAMRFAWKLVRHVRSNAIVLAVGKAAVGIGGGQTNRVDAVKQACERAGDRAQGSALASDAYFPFADGIEAAAEAGVTAVVQPEGSMRDAEVLAAADKLGIAMVYTGVRHFRH